jgi:predicted XRE-type DNA-binding protein
MRSNKEANRTDANIYRHFGYPDADIRNAKAAVGSHVIRLLEDVGLSKHQLEQRTGVTSHELSLIWQGKFSRFTVDRLIGILSHLGQNVEFSVTVHPRDTAELHAANVSVSQPAARTTGPSDTTFVVR